MINLERVYEDDARKIKELGGLTVAMSVYHKDYTTQSLVEAKGRQADIQKRDASRKEFGESIKNAEEIIKYLKNQYP